MSLSIHTATLADAPAMADLLLADAERRRALDPVFWAVAGDARKRVLAGIETALKATDAPIRQAWLLAETEGGIAGLARSMLLPVPPIYAGEWGEPGLLLEDCLVADDAPDGAAEALLAAAAADLRQAGARLLLATSLPGSAWEAVHAAQGYAPLTLYLAKTLSDSGAPEDVRPAGDEDIDALVARSAENRAILFRLDPFWKPHAQADARFAAWMRRSLSFRDRDMMVAGNAGAVDGYIIAQPAAPLHFPPAHDISAVGVIDDFFHVDYADPEALANEGRGAAALLRAAEAAFRRRGVRAAMAVCPAAWTSKRAVLESQGYRTALQWKVKR